MNLKHGHNLRDGHSPTYSSWKSMKERCNNPKASNFKPYGGAGVRVCERWLSFENFLADMGERPEGTTLGRYGDKGNYEPGNCAWQTRPEQEAEGRKVQCKNGHDLDGAYVYHGMRYCRICKIDRQQKARKAAKEKGIRRLK